MTDDIRARVLSFLDGRPDLNRAQVAAHTTCAGCTIRGFLLGKVKESPRIREELERVLRLAQAGEILTPGGTNAITISDAQPGRVKLVVKSRDFYETETVRKIAQVLDYCATEHTIGLVTGDFGIGKTEGVKAWRRRAGRNVESLVHEFDSFSSSNKIYFIHSIAEALGIPLLKGSNNGGAMFRLIYQKLREHPCLLIFDQAEMVQPKVLQIVRQLHDRTHEEGVGVVLLAAPSLLARLGSSRLQDLGALQSRIGIYAPLVGLSRGEMAAVLKAEGVEDVDEAAFDVWWRATGGSMRRLMRAIDLIKSRHGGRRVTETTIAGVASHLWGMRTAA